MFPASSEKPAAGLAGRSTNRIEILAGCPLSASAFTFGFGVIASKRSEDGGERVRVRVSVTKNSTHPKGFAGDETPSL
jgi:hypothetical protein